MSLNFRIMREISIITLQSIISLIFSESQYEIMHDPLFPRSVQRYLVIQNWKISICSEFTDHHLSIHEDFMHVLMLLLSYLWKCKSKKESFIYYQMSEGPQSLVLSLHDCKESSEVDPSVVNQTSFNIFVVLDGHSASWCELGFRSILAKHIGSYWKDFNSLKVICLLSVVVITLMKSK